MLLGLPADASALTQAIQVYGRVENRPAETRASELAQASRVRRLPVIDEHERQVRQPGRARLAASWPLSSPLRDGQRDSVPQHAAV
jgi:CBS-domain-containing membrane protein